MSFSEFVKRSKEKFGDKFSFDENTYKDATTPMRIYCHEKDDNGIEHGWFETMPFRHLYYNGCCPICKKKATSDRKRLTFKEFVEKARKVHGDKYEYREDLVNYRGNKIPVGIICPIHGLFYQRPNGHLNGCGCPECGENNISEKKLYDLIKSHYPDAETQHKEEFLHSATSYQYIDIYIPSLKIDIEHQGCQHFRPISHFGGIEGYNSIHERDVRKYEKCKEHGIKIFYFSYEPKRYIPSIYIDKVYTNEQGLLNAIEEYVKGNKNGEA